MKKTTISSFLLLVALCSPTQALAQFGAWKKAIRKFHEVEETDAGLRIPILGVIGDLLVPHFTNSETNPPWLRPPAPA
jgi:hypothetical protein